MWMPEVSVISSEEVFALQMVRPTFGLFNRIRKKKSILQIQAEAGMISSWQSTAARGFCFACDRQHKSWKNTVTISRRTLSRCAALLFSSRGFCCYVSYKQKKMSSCALAARTLACGQFWKGDFTRSGSALIGLFGWWLFFFQPSNSAAASTSTIVCQAQLVLTVAVAINMNLNVIHEVTSRWISG